MLEAPRIHSPGRQCVSGGVAQHVDMHRGRQHSGFPSPLDHTSDAHTAEGLAALIDEDVGRFDPFSLLLPAQELKTIDLIPLQVMDTIRTALEAADNHGALRQVDIVPAEVTSLRDPQAVSIDDQANQPIPAAMPVALKRRQQLLHFSLGQVLPDPIGLVPLASFRSTGRITNDLGVPQPRDFARHFRASSAQLTA